MSGCLDGAGLQGASHAQHVVPMLRDFVWLDAAFCQFIEGAVIGIFVDAPEFGFPGIGQAWRELIAEQSEQTEDHVTGAGGVRHDLPWR